LFLVPALGLAEPSIAQVRPSALSDSRAPGSLIVFPKFLNRSVAVDGLPTPATEIELGVVCPTGSTCTEGQPVKLRFHWVCPGFQDLNSNFVCRENGFDVVTSVNGKVVFSANAITITGSNSVPVPQAPCVMGYLVGWVIDPNNDQPVKFDGLIGDALIRESGTAIAAYGAIPVQAHSALPTFPATGSAIQTVPDRLSGIGRLAFDGAPGHYQAITGKIFADVRYDRATTAPFSNSYLILFTLDVRSGEPNYPVGVALDFYNESERLLSTSWDFVCWTEVPFAWIDPNLTQILMGTRSGLVVSGQAVKFPWFGIFDAAGPVTLLALVETSEGPEPGSMARTYFSPAFNDSTPTPAYFLPN
jgi:hypothetical protein